MAAQPQQHQPFIKSSDDISIDDVPLVGGKNATLGEIYRELLETG